VRACMDADIHGLADMFGLPRAIAIIILQTYEWNVDRATTCVPPVDLCSLACACQPDAIPTAAVLLFVLNCFFSPKYSCMLSMFAHHRSSWMDRPKAVSALIGWHPDNICVELAPLKGSGSPGADKSITCDICLEDFAPADLLSLPCKHAFCVEDWRSFVSTAVASVRLLSVFVHATTLLSGS
jgi:hypothetical protein